MSPDSGREQQSFTRAYDVDVFLSYAHIDNQEDWVAHFHERLQMRLQELLGTADVIIWRDPKLKGVDLFEDVLRARVSRSAIFLSILTPRYVTSSSCESELGWFVTAAGNKAGLRVGMESRLVHVTKTRLIDGTKPRNFESTLGLTFYEEDSQNKADFREFDSVPGMPRFLQFKDGCDRLALALSEILRKIRRLAPSVATNSRIVFLARTTSDMESRRASIRNELTGRGYTVHPTEFLPDSGPELRAALETLLAKTDVSVHLLGLSYGVIPEQETRSFGEVQYQLAFAQRERPDFRQLVWIPEDLQKPEDRQREFLTKIRSDIGHGSSGQTDVVETSFESFKENLLDVLKHKPRLPVLLPVAKSKRVYLLCDKPDLSREPLEKIQAYLRDRGHPVELPPFEGEPEELREVEGEQIDDSDAALIYYGTAKDVWIWRKRQNLLKVLSRKPTGRNYARALYLDAPKDDIKARVYLNIADRCFPEREGFPPLLVLGDCEDFQPEKLDAFIHLIEKEP
jgi:hypothetical protein